VEERRLPRASSDKGFNVLLVVVDTLRADHMSLYGYERETTPGLAILARKGLVFEEAVSQSSWTMPATASLLTGLYPNEHGVFGGRSLGHALPSLPDTLQRMGFSTFGVSANPVVGPAEGFDRGFERFVHLPWARASHVNTLFRSMVHELAGHQWFAYLHYIDPHDPYTPPSPESNEFLSEGESRVGNTDFGEMVDAINYGREGREPTAAEIGALRSAYDGEILYWDRQFKELVRFLDDMRVLDHTIIVVTSDHGEEFLEHGRLKHGLQLFLESTRVPLIVVAPGLLAPGRTRQLVETRTVSALIEKLITDDEPPRSWRNLGIGSRYAFFHTDHALLPGRRGRRHLASVSDGRWKYLQYIDDGVAQLFDLTSDPNELHPMESGHPEEARLAGLLEGWWRATQPQARAEVPGTTLKKLRAMGYIE
jgi:arylsulfatase A-like enzyme